MMQPNQYHQEELAERLMREKDLFDFVEKYRYGDRRVVRYRYKPEVKKSKGNARLRPIVKGVEDSINNFADKGVKAKFYIDTREQEIVCRPTQKQLERQSQINYHLQRIVHEMEENYKHAIGHARAFNAKRDAIEHAQQLVALIHSEVRNELPIYHPKTRHEYFVTRNRKSGDKIVGRFETFEEAEYERKRLSGKAKNAKESDANYFDHYQVVTPLVKMENFDPEELGWHVHREEADYGV